MVPVAEAGLTLGFVPSLSGVTTVGGRRGCPHFRKFTLEWPALSAHLGVTSWHLSGWKKEGAESGRAKDGCRTFIQQTFP